MFLFSAALTAFLLLTLNPTAIAKKTSHPSYCTTTATTFSIPTATNAAPTASGLTVDDGKEYITYSTIGGYFLQDLKTTVPSTFNYTTVNFGLINRTYSTDCSDTGKMTQWQRFERFLKSLNKAAPKDTTYKLFFIGRHGQGYHNAAESFYGTPAWNCYWAELDGNGTSTWADAHLTPAGITQALIANAFWTSQLTTQEQTPPQSFYVSPLTRCLQTANYTYAGLALPNAHPFVPTVKEFFREGISIHTCDRRGSRSYIADAFPGYAIESTLTEADELWNGISAETSSSQDYRSKIALDSVIATDKSQIISITTHSGETASLLRVLGHQPFSLITGEIIPVFVQAVTVKGKPAPTTTSAWTTSAWCTNGPPQSSQTTGAGLCVCSDGVAPTATTLAA